MNRQELEEWIAKNGTGHQERKYINRINYLFAVMSNGWIAVFEIDNSLYIPKFQASDMKHAINRCNMYEQPNVPFNVFE